MFVKYQGPAADQWIPLPAGGWAHVVRGGDPVDVPDELAAELCAARPDEFVAVKAKKPSNPPVPEEG